MKGMKGAILAGGSGSELSPYTHVTPKPLIKLLGKPLIQYAVERLRNNGIKEIYIVVEKGETAIPEALGDGKQLGVKITYVDQVEEGINGAIVSLADTFENEHQFVLLHSDIICENELLTRTLNAVDSLGADMGVAAALQYEVQDFGVVTIRSDGLVAKVHPHGDKESGNYVVAGTFILTGKIFDYLKQGIPFNEAFNAFINDNGTVAVGVWAEEWIDVGRPWDILRASRYLLNRITETRISKDVSIAHNSRIEGPVIIENGVKILDGVKIEGPAFIGEGALIGTNSLVRKYSTIEAGAVVGMGCEIKGSVLFPKSTISRLSFIGDSIIGERTTIHGGFITINLVRDRPNQYNVSHQGKEITINTEKLGSFIGSNCYILPNCTSYPGYILDSGSEIEANTVLK